jgi:hypothetical protein
MEYGHYVVPGLSECGLGMFGTESYQRRAFFA